MHTTFKTSTFQGKCTLIGKIALLTTSQLAGYIGDIDVMQIY